MAGPIAAAAVIGQAVGAIQNVVNEIKRLPDAVRGFVDAFNPAAGERLDYAFRSLQATIGRGLEPVISVATRIVEKFADAISGGMDRLRGPIEKVAGLFLGSLAPLFESVGLIFDGLADAGEALMPVFQALAPVFEAFLAFGHVLTAIGVESTLALIKGIIGEGNNLRSMTEQLTEKFLSLSESAVLASYWLLSLVGQQKIVVEALKRLAQPGTQGGRIAPAAVNVGMRGLEEIYKERLVAAARGSGKNAQEESADHLAAIRRMAEELLGRIKADPAGVAGGAQRSIGRGAGLFMETLTHGAIGRERGERWGQALVDWFARRFGQDERNAL